MAEPYIESVLQVQKSAVPDTLLCQLEAAEQPVLATASFLQDSPAVVVIEGLLNQIELMKRQHVLALEQIDHASKCKVMMMDDLTVKVKRAQYQPTQPVKPLSWVRMPAAVQPACLVQPTQPVTLSSRLPAVAPQVPSASLAAMSEPLAELLLS